ncbi:MAG: site-specific integrase [Proteobacteria bacterium]|nr:site-specific integrase [Pseudomonadota bacterium]
MNITKQASGIYHAERRVPKDVRHIIGKSKLTISLKTRDKRNALIEAAPILAKWDQLIKAARAGHIGPDQVARVLAEQLAKVAYDRAAGAEVDRWGYTKSEAAYEGFLDSLPDHERNRYADIGTPLLTFMDAFTEEVYNRSRTRLEAMRYLKEAQQHIPTLSDISADAVREWLRSEADKPEGVRRARRTMQKAMGYLSEYHVWLQERRWLHESVKNPFKDVRYPKSLAGVQSYTPLTLTEVLTVRDAAVEAGDAELTTYIDVARYTGMRIGEVGALSTVSVVTEEGVKCFKVREDAKTKAGSGRLVPIASALQKLMKANGYPLDSFDLAKADVKVSKRFGRYKKKLLDGGESRLKCFHGIRKYVATTLEREGVPEGITADLLGHEKQTMTYGVYSGGSSIEQLVSAVKKLEKAQK